MNVLAIYEQFRPLLGEEGAKGFAQTLDGLLEEAKNSVRKEDFRLLRESIDTNVSRLDTAITKLVEAQCRTEQRVDELAQAQTRTEQRLDQLAEAQTKTAQRVDELAEAQTRTERRVDELAEAQTRTERRLEQLAEAQTKTEQRLEQLAHDVEQLTHVLRRVAIRTDEHSGMILELRIRDRLASYVGLWLRRARLTDVAALIDRIEPAVSPKELEDLTRADLIAEGALDGQPTYVVGEVSWTADFEDIARAVRRASVLTKAGLAAVPLVACHRIAEKTAAYAHSEGVRILRKGRLVA